MGNTTALLGFTCAAGVLRAGRTETGKGASTTSAAEGDLAKLIAQLRAEGKLGGAEGSECPGSLQGLGLHFAWHARPKY